MHELSGFGWGGEGNCPPAPPRSATPGMVLNNHLSSVAEEEGLIADEQGGFRKRRGCRDQVLTVLLGQMEIVKKANGMMVAFIDFSKAYDKVDNRKLWSCLEGLGINGKFLHF